MSEAADCSDLFCIWRSYFRAFKTGDKKYYRNLSFVDGFPGYVAEVGNIDGFFQDIFFGNMGEIDSPKVHCLRLRDSRWEAPGRDMFFFPDSLSGFPNSGVKHLR